MADFDFPTNPQDGDIATSPKGAQWRWDSTNNRWTPYTWVGGGLDEADADQLYVRLDGAIGMTGELTLSGLPTAADSAASKIYVDTLVSSGGTFVDAPIDGNLYGRKDAAWEEVPAGGGGLAEAPIDGQFYSRRDATWDVAPPALPEPPAGLHYWRSQGTWTADPLQDDAPYDGKDYIRKDGAWEEILPTDVQEAPTDGRSYRRENSGWVADPIPLDAPADSQEYARKDNGWVRVTASAGISDAPADGLVYSRQNNAWAETPIQADCPSDGKIYSRLAGRWQENVIQTDAPPDGSQYVREHGAWASLPAGGLPEAPMTGTIWGRENGTWVQTIIQHDAPADGTPYARVDNAWAEIPPGNFVDSAHDGTIYARKDGTWEEVPVQDEAPINGNDYVRKDGAWAHLDLPDMVEEPPDDGKIYGRSGGIVIATGPIDAQQVGGAWHEVLPLSGGTITGELKVTSYPNDPLGVIPKEYADIGIANMLALTVQRSGGANAIMTGNLTLPPGGPTIGQHAVSRDWVETTMMNQPLKLELAGGTMTGDINMAGRKIINLIAPIDDSDVATKEYVDRSISAPTDYRGIWRVLENLPPLDNAALQINGHYYIAQTSGPVNSPGVPGLPTTTPIYNGDWVIWSDWYGQWQLIRGGILNQDVADARYLRLPGGTMTGNINFTITFPTGFTWGGQSTNAAIYCGSGINGDLVFRRPQGYDIILEDSSGGARSPILTQARADARYDPRYVPLDGSRPMGGNLAFPADQGIGVGWGRGSGIFERFPRPDLVLRAGVIPGGIDADILIQSQTTGFFEKVLTVQAADARYDSKYFPVGGGLLNGSIAWGMDRGFGLIWGRGSSIFEHAASSNLVLRYGAHSNARLVAENFYTGITSNILTEDSGDTRYLRIGQPMAARDIAVNPPINTRTDVQTALETLEATSVRRSGDEINGSLTVTTDNGGFGLGPSVQNWPGGIIQRQGEDMIFRRGTGNGDLYRAEHDGTGKARLATVDDVASIAGGPYLRTNVDGALFGINLTLADTSGIPDGPADSRILFGRYGGMGWVQGFGLVFNQGQVSGGSGYGHLYVANWDAPTVYSRVLDETYADAKYDARYLQLTGGVLTGTLTVPAPTLNGHAANKAYVDSVAGSGGGGSYLPLTGGDLTGHLGATFVRANDYISGTVSPGAHLSWDQDGNGGIWLLNQNGGKTGGIHFGEVSSSGIYGSVFDIDSIGNITPNGTITLNRSIVRGASIFGRNVATQQTRWQLTLGDTTDETGSNVGTNFVVARFGDTGTEIDHPITINRQTGLMTVTGDPTAALGVATKAYVDARGVMGGLPLTGGTMTGDINMGTHKIINLPDPTNIQDAATKYYVDSHAIPPAGGNATGYIRFMGPAGIAGIAFDWGGSQIYENGNHLTLRQAGANAGVWTENSNGTGAVRLATMNDIAAGGVPEAPSDGFTYGRANATWNRTVPMSGTGAFPMTGLLTLSGDPTAPMHAATKQYVDANAGGSSNGPFDWKGASLGFTNQRVLSAANSINQPLWSFIATSSGDDPTAGILTINVSGGDEGVMRVMYTSQFLNPPETYWAGALHAPAFTQTSAAKLKNSIADPTPQAIETAWNKLRPRNYKWNQPPPAADEQGKPLKKQPRRVAQPTKLGFVADEMGDLGKDGKYDIAEVLALAVAKIKQLETEIKVLKAKKF